MLAIYSQRSISLINIIHSEQDLKAIIIKLAKTKS